MTLKNPFSDFGGIIKGDRFVGRKSELNQIQKRLLGESFGNLAIIGLPRIGKSSLAWNSIIENKELLIQKKILPIWIPLGEFSNLIEFLDEVLSIVCDLIQITNKESFSLFNELRSNFHSADSNLEKRRFVKKFLRSLNTNSFRLIIVIDEFDNAQDIFSLQDFQFLRESSYNLETKIGIVTVSRKTIQELEPDNGSLSNFYQIFDELRLKLFSEDDILLYWQRLRNLGIDVTISYIENLGFYSGRHPFLLDLINYSIFNKIEQTKINLDEMFNSTLDSLKLKLYNEYESMLKLMEQEALDKKLVQLIIGPVYDITQRDVEKLLKYSLIKSTTVDSFECFSGFFEGYLSLKSAEIDIWPLWSNVEKELRQIIENRLIEKYGVEWEAGFEKEFGERRKALMESLRLVRDKNKKAFGEKASDSLIDYTYPMDMFNGFISSDWKWYSEIFGKKGQSNEWSKKFEHLGKVRNPLAHNNQGFLTESDKNICTGYCQEIITAIGKWKSQN
jgi:hypothetical protein